MKYYLPGILVVEGSNDASFVSSFIDTEIVILNGYDMRDVEYLVAASKTTTIYVMTDPDEAGEHIRNRLKSLFNFVDIRVDILKCNKNNKHGIAECSKDEIIRNMQSFFVKKPIFQNQIILKDLFEICNFEDIKNKFHLGNCNTKKMIQRLNTLKISKDQIYGNK